MVSRAQYEETPEAYDPATATAVETGVPEEAEVISHPLLDYLDMGNIVDKLDKPDTTASEILTDYGAAYNSMKEWREKYKEALKLAKLEPKAKHKTFPFEGASTAMLPFILEAMLDFNSRSAPELAFGENIVSAKVYGEKSEEKEERASRVSTYSNYQLSEMMPYWREEQDKNLLALPCVGTSYKKTYYDYDTGEVCSDLCLADEIVFDQSYKAFELAPDKYEKCSYTKNEVICYIRGEQQWDIDEANLDDEDDEVFIEAYTWVDLDGDGLEEPYYIVVWERNSKCVYMRPLFDEDTLILTDEDEVIKVDMIDIFTKYHYMPDPEGGPMGMGWGILLGSMFKAINTNLRQQIDAGVLMTTASNSGLINQDMTSTRGNSVQSGPISVKMGQLTPIQNRGSGSLSQNVVQFPFSGPNPTMFQLLEYLTQSARSMVTATADIAANPGEAQGLYLARLQQGLKQPNVVIMRIYGHAKKEFQAIFKLNEKHYSDDKYNRVLDEDKEYSMLADFGSDDCDIRLVADPSQGSDLERAARAGAILEEAKTQPSQVLNLREAYLNWLKVMQVPEETIEILAPEPQGQDPMQALAMAEMAKEAELKERDQKLREQGQQLQYAKMQVEMAKEARETATAMADAGMQADKTEAEITKIYTEALKNLYNIGMQAAIPQLQAIENQFINKSEGGLNNGSSEARIPASEPGPDRNLAPEPSNTSLSTVP